LSEINCDINTVLEIENLNVEYVNQNTRIYAVNGVNITLKKGKTLAIVGETGAGKTTLAYSIMQLLPSRTGRIKNGKIKFGKIDIVNLDEDSMRVIRGNLISMIFQDPMTSLNPTINVGMQIKESIELHNNDKKSKKQINESVDEILTLVGINPERKDDYPHQFSGGMKQRIVIAMALACSPQILIADEPTTALDVTIQAQVLNMMTILKKQNDMSMIFITHDLGVVAKICDEVAVMYSGEIIEFGTFEDIYGGKSHHPYTDGLFGSIPDIKSDEKWLKPIQGLMPDPTLKIKGCRFAERCSKCMDFCREVHPKEYKVGSHMIRCHLFKQGIFSNE